MLGSSTPDGLAPLPTTGLFIFSLAICVGSILWALVNFVQLSRIGSDNSSSQKAQRVAVICQKILKGTLGYMKVIFLIGFVATVIFFLVIMGAIEKFDEFYRCLGFLFGVINSLICGIGSMICCCFSLSKIINAARFTLTDAHYAARKTSNLIAFLSFSLTVLLMSLVVIVEEWENPSQQINKSHIQKVSEMLIAYSFGNLTIAIACRIFGGIYAKGIQQSMSIIHNQERRLQRNHLHPSVICKAIGEILNKGIGQTLDFISYTTATISVAMYLEANNLIGTDQNGQIIFQLNILNSHLPILSVLFSLFFIILFSAISGIFMKPSSAQQVRISFKLQTYITIVLLIGFQALAAYLSLPAQFFIKQLGEYVRHPFHAYLCILFGMLTCLILTILAQLATNHPIITNAISDSCSTGSATNIIYGLSFGYFFNMIPFLLIAGLGYLSAYWLGAFGLSLMAVGFISLLPLYLNICTFYSIVDNASYVSFATKSDEQTIRTLIELAQTRKQYQPHFNVFCVGILGLLGYGFVHIFIENSMMSSSTSLQSPPIFSGLINGAMLPYLFSYNLIQSFKKVAPVIGFDLREQIDDFPAISEGKADPDFLRTNQIYSFQCLLKIKRFILLLFGVLVLGILLGPQFSLGVLIGCVVSGVQLSISSGISGSLWIVVKKQISLGNIKDDKMNVIHGDSMWGQAAGVGNDVGLVVRDLVSISIGIYILYICEVSCVFAKVFTSIHE